MFVKAEKKQGRLRVAIDGPSGSGKTYASLLIASGIIEEMKERGLPVGKGIAVIDTENGSATDYADRFEFDVVRIDAPYTVAKYIAAQKAAEEAGYAVVIHDSISHAWAGEGGLLQKKEQLDSRGGNSYTNWAPITKEHESFRAMILQNKIHLIATMRSKQDYIVETNDKGKQAPKKVGLAPIQREGMEYEFTVTLDLAMDHSAAASKDRTSLFDAQVFVPTKKTGRELLAWRLSGKAEAEGDQVGTVQEPAPAAAAAANGNGKGEGYAEVVLKDVKKLQPKDKDDKPVGDPYYVLVLPDGLAIETLTDPIASDAKLAKEQGVKVRVAWQKVNGKNYLKSYTRAPAAPPAAAPAAQPAEQQGAAA